MGATIFRMLWFLLVASVIAYAVYLVLGGLVHAQASRENQPIVVRDELAPGMHHLSGMVMVPTSCDQLSVRTEAISSSTFTLVFRTWHEPSIHCISDETPRYFRAILFAPSVNVQFIATLDGAGLPILVMPVFTGQTSSKP